MILQAQGVWKSYKSTDAVSTSVLRGISLTVREHEFVAIIGPSGAGKSTLLHVLASIESHDAGSVTLSVAGSEYNYGAMTSEQLARFRLEHIGFVYQFHHLLPEFTALENVMMPALIRGLSHKDATKRAEMLLERVGLSSRSSHMPAEMSGGEQQRIAIARAVMNAPTLVLADEPTGNLDSANAQQVRTLLRELQQEQSLTCIIATHSMELAQSASRIVHIQDGICA
jgi:lipoprotein-releasing system ATP-binding protein